MTARVRIAVHMQPISVDSDEPTFKAALPMRALFEQSLDKFEVQRACAQLEDRYCALVKTLRIIRPTLKEGDVLRYWSFGDAIAAFEDETKTTLVFVDKLSAQLARDVDYSRTMIDLCRRFRLKFPDPSQLNPELSFSAYHRSGFDTQRAAASRPH